MRSKGGLGVVLAIAVMAAGFAFAGCGSGKPSYCSPTSTLKSDVGKLTGDVTSANFSAVQSDLTTIKTNAKKVVSDAKSDFPDETNAVDSSITSLSDAVNALPASPSAQQILELVPKVTSAVNAVESLSSAVSSKC
jgi:uncharacterized protein involved in exopolysaccharide biosynthesis